jgi:pSer/pThr/pTyr-binding forkhead associated (FHA) protein
VASPEAVKAPVPAAKAPAPAAKAPAPAAKAPAPPASLLAAGRARLVSIREGGGEVNRYELDAVTDIGRDGCTIDLEGDRYVAARHARIELAGGIYHLHPVDRTNGVFLRLSAPADLADGDTFIVGRQLFRFELPNELEALPRPSSQSGVLVWASPPRSIWGRIVQISSAGFAMDCICMSRTEIVIGREGGDVLFPEDDYMSRTHAMVAAGDGHPKLSDLESSNGTYLKLRGPHELVPGDLVRIGDHLFRFDA